MVLDIVDLVAELSGSHSAESITPNVGGSRGLAHSLLVGGQSSKEQYDKDKEQQLQ